jgi:hypothetical protein
MNLWRTNLGRRRLTRLQAVEQRMRVLEREVATLSAIGLVLLRALTSRHFDGPREREVTETSE